MYKYTKLSLLIVTIATTGAFAIARGKGIESNPAAINRANISLGQAIVLAEQQVGGKASRAEYESTKQGWVYDVEVVSGVKIFDVRIDAEKGTVISYAEDKADYDDDHDNRY